MSKKPALIIVHGPSATGKTILAERLSKKFSLPLISKDGFKEIMFDVLGWEDLNFNKKLGQASFELLWYAARQLLKAGDSLIVETKFESKMASEHIKKLSAELEFNTLQILCFADGKELVKRFVHRDSTDRHPGHKDVEQIDAYRESLLAGREADIEIDGQTIEVDTTDFSEVDYEAIDRAVSKVAEGNS